MAGGLSGAWVLVTGGAGFVGSHLVRTLADAGARVTILDDLSRWGREGLHGLDDCAFVEGSVLDASAVHGLVAGADVTFHLATKTIGQAARAPALSLDNVGGTFNVLNAARRTRKPVVFTSSASVYGDVLVPTTEDGPLDPKTAYAVSKRACELYCDFFRRRYGLPVTVLRYTNTYGPTVGGRPPFLRGAVARMLTAVVRGEPVTIYGDGCDTRDYAYVADVVRGTITAGERLLDGYERGGVFNLGTGIETSALTLADTVRRITGSDAPSVREPGRVIDKVRRRALHSAKAWAAWGWRAGVDLETGIRRCYEAYGDGTNY